MSEPIKIALIAFLGVVLGAAVSGWIGWKQYELQREQLELQRDQAKVQQAQAERERNKAVSDLAHYRQVYKDAPGKFTLKLGGLIGSAAEEGPSNLVVNARTIITVRNEVRSSLETLGNHLNSEIDELAAEISKPEPDLNNAVPDDRGSEKKMVV